MIFEFEVLKRIKNEIILGEKLNDFIIKDSKIIKFTADFLNYGKEKDDPTLIKTEDIKTKILNLKLNSNAVELIKNKKKITLKNLFDSRQNDKDLITALQAVDIGSGLRNISPYPFFTKMMNSLLGNLK